MAAPDLDDEQAYIDRAYVQLQRMRVRAEELLASMKGVDLDWKTIEAIWSSKGYRWDEKTKEFVVTR